MNENQELDVLANTEVVERLEEAIERMHWVIADYQSVVKRWEEQELPHAKEVLAEAIAAQVKRFPGQASEQEGQEVGL